MTNKETSETSENSSDNFDHLHTISTTKEIDFAALDKTKTYKVRCLDASGFACDVGSVYYMTYREGDDGYGLGVRTRWRVGGNDRCWEYFHDDEHGNFEIVDNQQLQDNETMTNEENKDGITWYDDVNNIEIDDKPLKLICDNEGTHYWALIGSLYPVRLYAMDGTEVDERGVNPPTYPVRVCEPISGNYGAVTALLDKELRYNAKDEGTLVSNGLTHVVSQNFIGVYEDVFKAPKYINEKQRKINDLRRTLAAAESTVSDARQQLEALESEVNHD